MILEKFLDLIYGMVSNMMVFQIPDLPSAAYDYIESAFDYIVAGAGLLANYTPLDYLMTLFGVLLAVDGGILIYHLVMWILKKIPVIGVE